MTEYQGTNKPKILIVEDEAIIAIDLKSHLDQMGYTVLAQVNSAEKAIELVEQELPDLVLMDIILKGKMDGIEAADIIRSRWGIPVVFCTAYAGQGRLKQAKLVYPFGYILKPFQNNDLKITVEMALYVSKVDKERRKAEEALQESEELHRITIENISDPVFLTDDDGKFTFICPNVLHILGYSVEEIKAMGNISACVGEGEILFNLEDLKMQGEIFNIEAVIVNKNGSNRDYLISVKRVSIKGGTILYTCHDITERKREEEERKANIRFLETMERVDQAIKQEINVEKMLWNMLETVFSIFDCDRAWLVYPCDPDAPSFRVPMEICRPGYPGANALDRDVPMSPGEAQSMREALESDDPVIYTDGTERPISTAKQFGVQSQIFVPVYPKLGKPWVFGMHQCSYPRIWTKEEKKLFKEIGRRISDGLSSVLFLRKLEENEERYRTVIEQSNDGIALVKGDRHIFVNRKMAEIFGYDRPEEIVGKPIDMIVHPDDQERVEDIIRRRQKGEAVPLKYEFKGQRKNGEFIHIEVSAAKTTYRGEVVSLAYLRDITERKQAEEVLRESQQIIEGIINAIPVRVFWKDKNLVYLGCNALFARDAGFADPKDIIGKNDYLMVWHDQAELYRGDDRQVLESGCSKFLIEEPQTTPEGNTITLLTSKTPLRSSNGEICGVLGTYMDITDRKQAEEALNMSMGKLRKAMGGIIQAMALTIETRDPYTSGHQRRVADMARSIAHEMGLSEDQVDGLRMAGIVHDLGKIAVPAEILSKPTKLSNLELALIKVHPQTSYDILKDIDFPWPVAEIVLQHHERLDGSGYPQGLKGANILLEARILAVADVVEAIASHRPYRPALGIDAALEEIEKNKGILYDAEAVDVCLRLFREKGFKLE